MELLLLALIGMNGALAMSELALVSARPARLEQAASRGDRGAARALAIVRQPTRFLSTVQVGITLIGILSGAIGEAALADDVERLLAHLPALDAYRRELSVVLVVLLLTYVSLVVGELVPKRLAMLRPESIARSVAGPMRVLSLVASPAVWLLSVSTEVLTYPFRRSPDSDEEASPDDVRGLMAKGARAGVFHRAEQRLVEGVFDLADVSIRSLMVPRAQVIWIAADSTGEQIRELLLQTPHTHFPVCRDGLDQVVGIAHLRDLLRAALLRPGEPGALHASVIRPPLFVPDSTSAVRALDTFRQSGAHLAVVVDEHGTAEGIITLSALLGAVAGEIQRPGAPPEPLVVRRFDGSFLVDGRLPLGNLKELLGTTELPNEDTGYTTAAGFVLANLGRIPSIGDEFAWAGWRTEVVDMDGRRIDRLLIQPVSAPA